MGVALVLLVGVDVGLEELDVDVELLLVGDDDDAVVDDVEVELLVVLVVLLLLIVDEVLEVDDVLQYLTPFIWKISFGSQFRLRFH